MGAVKFVLAVCGVIVAVWVFLIPDAIMPSLREGRAISEAEGIWKQPWLGHLLLGLATLCVTVGWWLPIPSGYAITLHRGHRGHHGSKARDGRMGAIYVVHFASAVRRSGNTSN